MTSGMIIQALPRENRPHSFLFLFIQQPLHFSPNFF
jgi:hypothetical protein